MIKLFCFKFFKVTNTYVECNSSNFKMATEIKISIKTCCHEVPVISILVSLKTGTRSNYFLQTLIKWEISRITFV